MLGQNLKPWGEALRATLSRVYDPTTRTPVPWLLSGEAALALQGVRIEPEVIVFRAISPVAAAYFTQFMKPFEASAHSATVVYRRGGNLAPSDSWRSNIHQRIVAWSAGGRACWLGRWHVEGVPVQVSYIQSIHPDPVALTLKGSAKCVRFEGMDVPVVPLEYLLANSTLKNDTVQTQRILHTMRSSGYSAAHLQKALSVLPSGKASKLSLMLEFSLVAG